MVGREHAAVYHRPRVAILPTGDEIVEAGQQPEPFQIRNSNAWSMAVQVRRAGGDPQILPIARDNYESTRGLIEQGLNPICCCSPAAFPPASTTSSSACWPIWARNSFSTAC